MVLQVSVGPAGLPQATAGEFGSYRKIAVRYLNMAEDLLKWADRPRADGLDREGTKS